MNDRFIFWEQDIRITGPGPPRAAITRLGSLLSARRLDFSSDRLTGSVDGMAFRVWRRSPFAIAGDIVQCEGVIRPHGDGSAIDGKCRYKLATRIQFLGCLAIGAILLVAGLGQQWTNSQSAGELTAVGLLISLVSLVWIYSSSRMKNEQIRFIEARLDEIVSS